MVILASFQANVWLALGAAVTLVVGAAYTLWLVKRVVFGEVANHHVASLKDISRREGLVLASYAMAVLLMGLWPKPVTDLTNAAVAHVVQQLGASKL
jgi:NADH-quinone oxidoreductase subunit M